MPILLHLDSSPMGGSSISRRLTGEFVSRWVIANPTGKVVSRDLSAAPIPAIDAEWIQANMTATESRSSRQHEILALSTELVSELFLADEYVFGIPMHNWGPSSNFKLWADQIVRFGETIVTAPSGAKGMLTAKRATFILAAGRHYDSLSPDAAGNYLEPWLRTLFGYLGVRDMKFILADGVARVMYGKIDRTTFLTPHLESVHALFQEVPLLT